MNTPGEFVGGVVQQEIPTAHKRQLSREKFLARTRVSEWIALAQEWQVLNDVRIHYFRTLGQQEIVEVEKELLKSAEDSLVTTRELYNLGRATQADLHLANVALQQQRLTVLRSENTLRRSWQELTALAGVDLPYQPLAGPLESTIPAIQWNWALGRLMEEAPQLQQARVKLVGDQIQVERELVEPVPNIFVQGGAGYNFEAEQTVGAAQIFMEVPMWDKNQGTIRQARADLARQQAEIRRMELWLRRELGRVYDLYLTALQHVQSFEQVILPEARQAYEVRLDSYEDDRIPWTDVLTAQSGYFALRSQYVQNLVQLRESEVLITGYLLHGGLMVPERPTPPEHIDVSPQPR
jgi:outer membrane protein TolC